MEPFTLEQWRALPKEGWHGLIKRWNRRNGTMKKVSVVAIKGDALWTPDEKKQEGKRRRKEHVWNYDEIPTRLPYRKEGEKILCDPTFLAMTVFLR